MKYTKRILSFALVLVMVFALCAPALADAQKKYEPYKVYTCLGDSVAAGYGTTDYAVPPLCAQQPNAYHTLLANALGAELRQFGWGGFRSHEIRHMIDPSYEITDWHYADNCAGFVHEADLAAKQADYIKGVEDADILTGNIGSNDLFGDAMLDVFEVLYAEPDSNETLDAIKEHLQQSGNLGAAFVELMKFAESIGKLNEVMTVAVKAFYNAYEEFKVNFDAIVKSIYDRNPDVELVIVGMFNPLKTLSINEGSLIKVGKAAEPLVLLMNSYMKSKCQYSDKYIYVDVTDVELHDIAFKQADFWEAYLAAVHPTDDGHKFITQQILNALPERGTLPFADVPADAWYYDELYYAWFNGLIKGTSETTFSPAATTTRAQLVTVLYRMAGSPNVSGLTEPFTDVSDNHWARDAIIWAYESAFIKGYNATTFGPEDGLTRAQLVTILHRYAGSPTASGDLGVFSDSADIASSYRNAVRWAVANGIVNGYNDGTFRPDTVITRAQLAAILARFDRM